MLKCFVHSVDALESRGALLDDSNVHTVGHPRDSRSLLTRDVAMFLAPGRPCIVVRKRNVSWILFTHTDIAMLVVNAAIFWIKESLARQALVNSILSLGAEVLVDAGEHDDLSVAHVNCFCEDANEVLGLSRLDLANH
ncbi:MAG: hypothetical protein JW395_2625 [Nitrospira sp.]|nr:hypothetical protein [Nitrospira sp.]